MKFEDVHWVSMYRNVYDVWRTSWFCFFPPPPPCTRLCCWAQMFHTNTNLLFLFWFGCCCCCCSVGPEVFAFFPSVLCVKMLCYYEWAFVLFSCSTERDSQRRKHTNQNTKFREGNHHTQGWKVLQLLAKSGNTYPSCALNKMQLLTI